jgi:hypothetical protein
MHTIPGMNTALRTAGYIVLPIVILYAYQLVKLVGFKAWRSTRGR